MGYGKGETAVFDLDSKEVKAWMEGIPSLHEYKAGDTIELIYYGNNYEKYWMQRAIITHMEATSNGINFDALPIGKPRISNFGRYFMFRLRFRKHAVAVTKIA